MTSPDPENPFTAPSFYGRRDVVRQIEGLVDLTARAQYTTPLVLLGPTGSGRSTIVSVAQIITRRHEVGLVQVASKQTVAESLDALFAHLGEGPSPLSRLDLQRRMPQLARVLAGRSLMILADDLDPRKSPLRTRQLLEVGYLAKRANLRVGVVVAGTGSPSLLRTIAPQPARTIMELHPLSTDETEQALGEPTTKIGMAWSGDTLARASVATGGHPALIKAFGHYLVSARGKRTRINLADLDAASLAVAPTARRYTRDFVARCTPDTRRALSHFVWALESSATNRVRPVDMVGGKGSGRVDLSDATAALEYLLEHRFITTSSKGSKFTPGAAGTALRAELARVVDRNTAGIGDR